jgi:glycosyltransferase involved in cell wall biosynthesis
MNILVLTSIYPQVDDEENIGVTPVVQYFAKEWVKAGHRVVVIHNSSKYPRLFYLLPDSWLKRINSKLGIVIPSQKQTKQLYSKVEGVVGYRIPMLKIIPKSKYLNALVVRQFNKILQIISHEKFMPDLVIGHWENPQIQLLSMFKEKYAVKTALVFHAIVYIKQKRYNEWVGKNIKNIDAIGARSQAIANEVKEILSLKKNPFICYSGIADKYFDIDKYRNYNFGNKIASSYLFVGRLIKRKNVDSSILALKALYMSEKFLFNIVGEGAESEKLSILKQNLDLDTNIRLLGYKSRDEVLKIMSETEVFIMISDNETFGLVYIEAMSQGCIVIASKHGGMDGIIVHGFNGFLCEQGNEKELEEICMKIKKMSTDEKTTISRNAINTALNFRDSMVAKIYLENIVYTD